MKALDLSFSSASRAWCEARKAEGWELIIVNLWTGAVSPVPARANLANARAAGMLTAGYTVVNTMPATAVNKAAYCAGTEWEHLAFVSVDVEVATTPAIVRQAVDGLKAIGKKVCIYTGAWFWSGLPGDFSDVPAWLADYDGNPALDTARLARLGPVIGKQYRGSHDIGGVTVDANTFSDSFVKGDVMAWTLAETARVKALEVGLAATRATLNATVGFVRFNITNSLDPFKQYVAIGGFKVHIQDTATLTAMGLGRTPCLALTATDTLALLPELALTGAPHTHMLKATITGQTEPGG